VLLTGPASGLAAQQESSFSRQPQVTSVVTRTRAFRLRHEARILGELAALLALPNVASDSGAMARNAELLSAMLERRGFATRLLASPEGGPPAVYGLLPAPGATRTLVFYAHYDGQPAGAGWAAPPWRPELRTGRLEAGAPVVPFPPAGDTASAESRIYARSASDDKGPIVALLAAVDALSDAGIPRSVNLKVFLEGEEEAGSSHLRSLLEAHAPILAADLWLFADGPIHQSGRQQIVFGVRGVMSLDLTVYGPNRGLHSGHYGNWAPNPISALADLLGSMRAADGRVTIAGFHNGVRPLTEADRQAVTGVPVDEDALRRSLGLHTTEGRNAPLLERLLEPALNFTGIRAGGVGAQASNTIQPEATASLDIRLVPDQRPEAIRAAVESHVTAQGYHIVGETPDSATRLRHPRIARLNWSEGYGGVRTSLDSPAARAVLRVADAVAGEPVIRVPSLGGSLPMILFRETLGVPMIIVPMVNHDNNQHASNENLKIRNLRNGIDLYAALLASLGEAWDREEPR
jgi:acetylornithine deacetylase/succinyl-diaminopimelate desuccinylase-like protein